MILAGSQFDELGNLKSWWNDVTRTKFEKRAQCIIDQYSSIKVTVSLSTVTSLQIPGTDAKINGKNTQGENIADNGGLRAAYKASPFISLSTGLKAYHHHEAKHGKESRLPGLDFTSDQVFFVGYAVVRTFADLVFFSVVVHKYEGGGAGPASAH